MATEITFSLLAKSDGFEVSIVESYANIFTTPKNTVTMLPEFGCGFHELIDRPMDDDFLIDYRRHIIDATVWEPRKTLDSVKVVAMDAVKGTVKTLFNFTDGSYFEGVFNGFA
jgi:phage baseplate assembly protein W